MNELPVFMSYRRTDGTELALRLRKSLHGHVLMVPTPSGDIPATVSVYFDQAIFAGVDWQDVNGRELERACAFLVVCSPSALYESRDNWFYREIRWWLNNRSTIPPILVTNDENCIPALIREKWPDIQFVKVDLQTLKSLEATDQESMFEIAIQSILGGISVVVRGGERRRESPMTNVQGLFTWEKDVGFRYIRCNDNYARAAGYDSPAAMQGKTDDDMPWHSLADFFRSGDQQVISGVAPPRIHVQEKEIMVDRAADILVTENQLLDQRGECVGLTGYFIDITGHLLLPRGRSPNESERGLHLGKEFGDEYLSEVEVAVFKGILKSYSAERIAAALGLGREEVESHMRSIKRKLQCVTDGDVIATAIRSGLPLTLFGPERIILPDVPNPE